MAKKTPAEALQAVMDATTPCLYFVTSDYFARPVEVTDVPLQGTTLVTILPAKDTPLPPGGADPELILLTMWSRGRLIKRAQHGFINSYTAANPWDVPAGVVMGIVWTPPLPSKG